jgi:MFS family permease
MTKTVNGGKRPTASLYLPVLLVSLPLAFLRFGLPVYGKALGANALAIGGLFSALTVTMIVMRPAVGWGLDRFGRKRFFVAALVFFAVAWALFAYASTLASLYLARLVQGSALSLLWVSVRTIVADMADPEDRGRAMGRINQAASLGQLYGALAGFAVISLIPAENAWPLVFAGYAIVAALAARRAWRVVPETRPIAPLAEERRRPLSGGFLKLLVIVFTTGASAAMIAPIYLIFLQDKFTTDIGTLAWAFFPAGLAYSLLVPRLGGLSDRLGRAPLMALGLTGAGFLSLLLPGLPSLAWLVILYTVSAVLWAMADPAEEAMVADLSGEATRGRGYGLYDLAGGLGATIGPLLGGWLYDNVGQALPFYLNGVVLLLSAVWVLIMLRGPAAGGRVAKGPIAADPAVRMEFDGSN